MNEQGWSAARAAEDKHPLDDRSQSQVQHDAEINLADVFATLNRARWTVARSTLSLLLISVVTAFALPVQYASIAQFIPPSNGSSASSALAGQLSALAPAGLLGAVKSSGDLYAGILKSRSIADELVRQFNLREVYGVKRDSDAVKRLGSHTAVLVGMKDTIITLTVTDKSPERARDLANAYLDALRETNGRLALTESSQRRLFFDQQLAKEKNDLEEAEVSLKEVKEQSGLIAPSGQAALEIETIAKTKAQIASRQIELSDLRQSSTEQNPEVIRLRGVIADLQGQLARLQNGNGKLEPGDIPTSKVPQIQLEYVRREREVKYHEALFEMIAKQDEVAHMDELRDSPLLQVLDTASYPDHRASPPRTLIMVAGFSVGLFGSCLWVLWRRYGVAIQSSLRNSTSIQQ
ncbi:Uncharacterized protein involved in exopolysaccharide biosynthesis [Granulicella pectinivorans]|uniref:Uncharacterized protein involved in exopolysaccharide biosynthesis n=1 Tax=Granulicella pectinivorans TaxID=474950 RepID=A0A1I6M5G1_9BACT|nr:Wzz/FepE/Etk N-terminal domain-containing protein [Granulicella pectinivorans]SFS10965.1 Uncharacterized protein involved in exopolysaccharide biosynthesis [Granulicella pectinivorans]